MTEAPLIYGLMAKAVKMFGDRGIGKDDKNKFQNFSYRSIDSTLEAANRVFSELGLFLTISAEDVNFSRHTVETNKGARIDFTMQARYTVSFYAPDGSSVSCKGLPAANTGQDDSKLAGQVMSYILKEALFKTFLIPVEGNEDTDGLNPSRNQPGPKAKTKVETTSDFY